MKKISKVLLNLALISGITLSISQPSMAVLHPLAKRVVDIINKEGQAGLCKKGGIFRERVGLKLTPGGNCDNRDFAGYVAAACGGDADFKTSECMEIINRKFGTAVVAGAPAEVEQSVKLKHENPYAMVCSVKRENLTGILKSIADRSCDKSAPARPGSAAPASAPAKMTAAEKQKVKAIIQKDLQAVDALKIWVSAKPNAQRGNIAIGSQRVPTITIKAPQPTDPSQQTAFYKAAESVSASIKKFIIALDSNPAIVVKPAQIAKLESFGPEITESSSLSDMQNKLAALEALVNDMEE